MGAPSLLSAPWAAWLLLAVGVAVAAWAARALFKRRADARLGRLVAVDAGAPSILRSDRYRLEGRPDAVRELPDGRAVPIELKSRPAPRGGPPASHLVQVWAYCLLVEEETGRAPPFGILRYVDGEYRVPWDRPARAELLRLRDAIARPYDGRATPSPGRCARCPWSPVCDLRAPGTR